MTRREAKIDRYCWKEYGMSRKTFLRIVSRPSRKQRRTCG